MKTKVSVVKAEKKKNESSKQIIEPIKQQKKIRNKKNKRKFRKDPAEMGGKEFEEIHYNLDEEDLIIGSPTKEPHKPSLNRMSLAGDEDPSSIAHCPVVNAQAKKQYAIATTDTAFNHLLSIDNGNKDIMLSFLQAFVPSFGSDPIASIESYPVAIPVLKEKGEKQTFVDLHVRTQNGARYIIEMQAKRHIMFDERALYYACSAYANQLTKAHFQNGPWYKDLKPVIAIQVLDYDSNRVRGVNVSDVSDTFIKRAEDSSLGQDQYIKHYKWTDCYSQKIIDFLQIIQVELPRGKTVINTNGKDYAQFSAAEWWVELLCFSSEYTDELIRKIKESGVRIPEFFEKALSRLNIDVWAPKMQNEYAVDLIDRAAYATVLAVERMEGKAEGKAKAKAEAKAKGKLKERKKIARRMLRKDIPDETIVEFSKLTSSELDALKASLDLKKNS
jgi:hypothetical protein